MIYYLNKLPKDVLRAQVTGQQHYRLNLFLPKQQGLDQSLTFNTSSIG